MGPEDKFILENEHFVASLHENQCYLGRARIIAKREDAVELFRLSDEELFSFYEMGRKFIGALDGLFHPNLYNHFVGGNVNPHFHSHLIPRYANQREFGGGVFVDNNWGKNYAPYNKNFRINDHLFFKIRDALRERLK